MVRTIEVPGDQLEIQPDGIKVHTNIGAGRVISAILRIEEPKVDANSTGTPPYDQDPFGKELDDLLAMNGPTPEFVDDSREAIYTPDEELPGKPEP